MSGPEPDAPPLDTSWLGHQLDRLGSGVSATASMPTGVRWALAIGLMVLVGLLDIITGPELSVSVFYLVPVLFADAVLSRNGGRALAVMSATTWGAVEVLGGNQYSAGWILVWNSGVRLVFFLLINELADANRIAHARDRVLARTDALTGLANGRTFLERVELAIAGTRRHGRPFTIAYLDLDRFKQVNDRLGHGAGDRLLRAVAETMETATRATDLSARMGGDEFGILLVDTTADEARSLLDRLAASVSTSLATALGKDSGASVTMGAVTFLEAPDSVGTAMHEADSLMYLGKQAGGSQIRQQTWSAAGG